MLEYKTMSLFDAPKGSIIVHACNSQGVWGSGIAKEFKERYPESYEEYKKCCILYNKTYKTACGRSSKFYGPLKNENHDVGFIITSHNYGDLKDTKEVIKINTTLALFRLVTRINLKFKNPTVYSNKFNSGLFGVPWEETELILKTVLRDFKNITWIVCDPKGEK